MGLNSLGCLGMSHSRVVTGNARGVQVREQPREHSTAERTETYGVTGGWQPRRTQVGSAARFHVYPHVASKINFVWFQKLQCLAVWCLLFTRGHCCTVAFWSSLRTQTVHCILFFYVLFSLSALCTLRQCVCCRITLYPQPLFSALYLKVHIFRYITGTVLSALRS